MKTTSAPRRKLHPTRCAYCGTQIEANPHGRPREYCSQSCRKAMAYWRGRGIDDPRLPLAKRRPA